jgi:hypothetical protein
MVRRREDVKLPRTLNVELVNGDFDDASSLDAAHPETNFHSAGEQTLAWTARLTKTSS